MKLIHSKNALATLRAATIVLFALPSHLWAGTVRTNFSTPGTFTWTCPDGITNVLVECWGGGGASGGGNMQSGQTGSANNAGGGSGGGGAYAMVTNMPVTPGTNYTVNIPAAAVAPATWANGDASPAGSDVTFTGDAGVTCTAAGGQGGTNVISTGTGAKGVGGAGGATANCVGDIAYAGGSGASAYGNGNTGGGGGGAGDSGPGGTAPAAVTTAGIGGTGALQAGGNGGAGKTGSGVGNPGNAPGGGAGGAKRSGSLGINTGGNGALGRMALTYGVPTYKADNTLDLTNSASWTAGVPGASEVAHWNNIVTSANAVSLGADTSWAGISIQNPGGPVTINAGNTLTLTSSGIGTAIDLTSATADLTLDCALTLGAASAWSVTSGRTLTVAGAISGTYGINMNGSGAGGTVSLSGANTAYSGNTTVGGGTLTLGNANAAGSGGLAIAGGTLQLTDPGALNSSASLSLASGTTLQLRNNSTSTFNTPAWPLPYSSTANQTFTIDVDNNGSGSGNTLTLSGGINNYPISSASMNKTLNITGANGYSLSIPTINSWGLNGSAYFTINPTTASVNIGAISVNTAGDGQQCNLAFGTASSGSTSNSINSIAETSGNAHQLILQFRSGTWAVGNINLNQGNGSQVNGGTLIVNGTITFGTSAARTFTLNSGTLDWNNAGAFRTIGTATAQVVLNGGYLDNSSGAAITTSTYNPQLAWGAGFTFVGSQGTNSDLYLGNGAVALNADCTATISASTLTVGGVISGAHSLTKGGAGTLVLSGANTYTGNTDVSAGTLTLADNAQLTFVLGAATGTNNTLTGAGTAILNGDFVIDTSAADALSSGTWTLEAVTSLTDAYGPTFRVVGFVDAGNDKWTKAFGATKTYTFDETTGILTLTTAGGYSAWQTANGTAQTIDLDHDNDGVANGIEYFLTGDANSTGFTALPGVVKALDGTLSITWTKAASYTGTYGTDFWVETSATLAAGSWAAEASPGTVTITGSDVKYTFPAGTKSFARLRVTGP